MIQEHLKQRLDVLRGTLRKASVLDGSARVVLAMVIGVLGAIVLDYVFFRWASSMNTAFRIGMLLAFVGVVATILYRRVFSPLTVPLSIDDMALSVEREFPQLNDNLISTIQLTRILAHDQSISAPMVEEVARQAHESTAALDFNQVVKFDRVKPRLQYAGGAVLALVVLCVIPQISPFVFTGIGRLFNPFSNARYPELTKIAIKGGQHDLVVPRNDPLHIVAEVSEHIPSDAYIRFKFEGSEDYGKAEHISTVRQNRDAESRVTSAEFDYEYNPVITSFDYIVLAGDSQTDPHHVRVVDRPELDSLSVQYELPKYIADAPLAWKRERSLRSVIGTRATIKGETNKPLDSAMIKLGEEAASEMVLGDDGKTFLFTIPIEKSTDYEIFLKDKDNLTNNSKIRHKIYAVPDAPPRVTWKQPNQDLEVAPTANVTLAMGLEDDWGLQKAGVKFKRYKMVAQPNNAVNPGGQNAPPPVADTNGPAVEGGFELTEPENNGAFGRSVQRLEITKEWSLAELALEPGDVVEYWAEAYDFCPTVRKAPEVTLFHLRVLSAEEIKRRLDVERLKLIDELKAIIRDQEGNKKQVDTLSDHLKNGNPFENPERARVAEAGGLQEEVRRKTLALQSAFFSLIARYRSNGLDTPDETARLQNMADVLGMEHTTKMPEAARDIAATAMVKSDNDRTMHLAKASSKQEEILTDLKALLEQMQKWQETEELLRLTRELLIKQRGVTRLTSEFKDRLGAKQPKDATKDESGQVTGLGHEERECGADMKVLLDRMEQAMAKMRDVDKWIYQNIHDAFNIAQNTDATPDNPDLPKGSDTAPGVQDKMASAESKIASFEFGMAMGLQKGSETGLERMITVLSRRREPDKQILRDIEDAKRNLQKILEQQRDLTKKTNSIMEKQELQQQLNQAKQQLQQLRQRQQDLMNQTKGMPPESDPRADALSNRLEDARKNLENLIKEENSVFKNTVAQLSDSEREIARAVHELEEVENDERALAKESGEQSDGVLEAALKQQLDKFKKLRAEQNDLRSKAGMASSAPDKARGADALKQLKDPESKLNDATREMLNELPQAADKLLKSSPNPSADLKAAANAIQQAGVLAAHAPDEMKTATDKLAEANGADSVSAQAEAERKLGLGEEVLLKAIEALHKKFEGALTDNADRQANNRGKLDEIAGRLAQLSRNAEQPENVKNDPKLTEAAKSAAKAVPDLENASETMGNAADTLRQASTPGDHAGAQKGAGMQTASADKIAAARAALLGISEQLAKDKQAEHAKNGAQQAGVQTQAQGLQKQIEQLAKDISAAQSGKDDGKSDGDQSGASGKIGEASKNMGDAQTDLNKPNPTSATRNESKAIDALEDARDKLAALRRQVEELKTPARKLERLQKQLKDEARKLATDIDKLESQMPPDPKSDKKAADNVKNASNNMQNAQNNLGNSASNSEKNGSKAGEGDKQDAAKEQDQALSELDKALKALDELASRAAKEPDPRTAEALKRLEEPQRALREEVLKLQKKLDELKDKTGNRSADKASSSTGNAAKNQSQASGQMQQGNKGGASGSEQEAEQDLQEALDNLDDFQKQMQDQQRNEELFQIEQELKKMLQVQKDILGRTQEVEKLRPAPEEKLPKLGRIKVKEAFKDQLTLADSAKVVAKKLDDAPVFQWVVQTTTEDMNEAARRLDKEESGVATQEIQEDAILKISELIDALRKERARPGQGGGGGGGGKQPLVPPIAELKMLKIMQRDVNTRTKQIDKEVSDKKDRELTKDQKDRLRRAAVKEQEISKITNKIANDLGGAGEESEEKDEDKEKP